MQGPKTETQSAQCTVLVTGAGGPLGVSIFKALRMSQLRPRIVATDADPRSIGLYRADAAHVLPHVARDLPGYLDGLREVVAREGVSLVCFGSEVEMEAVAPVRQRLERETGARLVVEDPAVMRAITDKWDMIGLLGGHALPVPDTALACDPAGLDALLRRHGFPVIVKPRQGSGSKGVNPAGDRRELEALCGYVGDAVVQEFLRPAEEEYTVGLYISEKSGYVGQITLRRDLSSGNTYRAEVVEDDEVEAVCRAFAERVGVSGPVNLQLRKTRLGLRIFEVNLRFSGSAVIRAAFGFNEPELAIRDLVLGTVPARPAIRKGFAFRYWDEVYLTPEQLGGGPPDGPIVAPMGERADLL